MLSALRSACPRCGSELVGVAPSGAPSECVLELRGGKVPVAVGAEVLHRLCRSCGHQWDPADPPETPDTPVDLGLEESSAASPAIALRRAREERGQTLSEASSGTRIWALHLQALEGDAPLEEFPAPAYARFFLREYAEYLKLDPGPLLREFEARHPDVDEPAIEPLAERRRIRPRIASVALVILSAAALVLLALLPPTTNPSPPAAAAPAIARDVDVHDSGRLAPARGVGGRSTGIRAVLRLRGSSWVEAVADGRVLESATLQPGDPVVFRARHRLALTLGNGGAVRLRVDGELVPTGTTGDVEHLAFRLRGGELVTIAR